MGEGTGSQGVQKHALRFFEEEVVFLFHITDGCNLACNHCFINASSPAASEFSLEEAAGIIADMKKLKTSHIAISGGEPTLHKDFVQILKAAHNEGFTPDFVTNGTAITDGLAEAVRDFVRCILISVDGPEEVHDAFRGKKGAFRRTMKSIKILKDHDIPFSLQFTVTKESLPFLEWIAETASQLGADTLKLEPLFSGGRAGRAKDIVHLCLNEKEIDELAETVTHLYGKYLASTSVFMGIYSKKVLVEHPCNAYACFGDSCHRGAKNDPRELIILPDGSLVPVDPCLHPAYYMGNVREKSLLQVVQDYFGSSQQLQFLELCRRVHREKVIPYLYEAIPWSQILVDESWRNNCD